MARRRRGAGGPRRVSGPPRPTRRGPPLLPPPPPEAGPGASRRCPPPSWWCGQCPGGALPWGLPASDALGTQTAWVRVSSGGFSIPKMMVAGISGVSILRRSPPGFRGGCRCSPLPLTPLPRIGFPTFYEPSSRFCQGEAAGQVIQRTVDGKPKGIGWMAQAVRISRPEMAG